MMHLPCALPLLLLSLGAAAAAGADATEPQPVERITAQERFRDAPKRWEVACSTHYAEGKSGFIEGCHPTERCGRAIQDGFVGPEDVARLKAIADRAMASQPPRSGGPTIADINSGYVFGEKLINIYETRGADGKPIAGQQNTTLFTTDDYNFYKAVIERIKARVEEEFGARVFFTSPTFITRIVGSAEWRPRSMHDEYWHAHVDKANTEHYDYSGLLYLSEYGVDFQGGLFEFLREDGSVETLMEPAPGRLFLFTSGRENPHRVQKVTSGSRYVLSFWFTCDERFHFHSFLDGKAHKRYRGDDLESSSSSGRGGGSHQDLGAKAPSSTQAGVGATEL